MKEWFKKLFWKRCFYCKDKKQWFFYTWEIDESISIVDGQYEICTDCSIKSK